ncbi:MAG: hypothetical protein HQK66_07315, partial [Desulfamplus sp.]|nr:hypothetical protein [Desulfamplus sp.]
MINLIMHGDNKKTVIVAMDIDDFLTTMEVRDLLKSGCLDPVHHTEKHFLKAEFKHNDHDYSVDNLMTPGTIEFLRFLFDHDFIRPAFFSAGIRSRNLDLGKKMVQTAIDAGGDDSWMDRYDVYSREDCFDTDRLEHMTADREITEKYQPPHFFGNYKKDLRVI